MAPAWAVLAKESAVLLPAYALSLELTLFQFRSNGARDGRVITLFVLVLLLPAVLGLNWLLPKMLEPRVWASRDFDLTERLLTESRVLWSYLRWTVLPDLGQLSLYHDDYPVSRGWLSPPTTLIAVLGLGALIAAVIALLRRRPLSSLGLQWFLGAHLLTATVIPLELVFEQPQLFCVAGRAAGGGRRAAAVHLASGAAPRYSGLCRGPAGVLDRCHRTTRARME